MKTGFTLLVLAGLPFLNGCTSAKSEADDSRPNVVVVESAPSAAPAVSVAPASENVPAAAPMSASFSAPSSVNLSPAAREIAKLAQSGVDQGVMIAYITNSSSAFRLQADDIVYLNDIGVAPTVVTAMIQHDQRLRQSAQSGPTVAEVSQAGASSYVASTVSGPAPVAQAEQIPTAPPPPPAELPAQETVTYFYDSLSPYGTWVDVSGYGRCWRPTVAVTSVGWRPYCNGGRWMWTDAGWYWYSDYSWGWAPFHYGRWFYHSNWGWCWMPGSDWGPSWVSWRYSDDYCGWAPLPPAACYSSSIGFTYFGSSCGSSFAFGLSFDCFTFVSYNNFHSHRYDRDCVPHHQAGHIYNNTTVVNNIIRGNNNTIINQGIAPTRITAASGVAIQQVNIRDTRSSHGSHGPRNEQLGQDGRSIQIVRGNVPVGHPQTVSTPTSPAHSTTPAAPPTRGGAHGLVQPTAPASPAPTVQHSLPTDRSVPPRGTHPVPGNAVAQSPSAAPAPTSPLTPTQPTANGSPSSAPNTRNTPAAPPTAHSAPASAPTHNASSPGSLVIRSSHPENDRNTRTTPSLNASAPAAQPVAPTSPSTSAPVPPRNNHSSATPWLSGPRTDQPSQPSTRGEPTSRSHYYEAPSTRIIQSPAASAPAAPSYSAPLYQAPSTPRSPAPAPSYNPPAQTVREQPSHTPAPQPSYSAPTRQSAPSQPSYSAPARSEPRPEPRSESRGSSSSSSSSKSNNDDRSSRGR
ncbi:MAG: hypothetical protein RLY20_173 [Verrucomicrobiota bacterium]